MKVMDKILRKELNQMISLMKLLPKPRFPRMQGYSCTHIFCGVKHRHLSAYEHSCLAIRELVSVKGTNITRIVTVNDKKETQLFKFADKYIEGLRPTTWLEDKKLTQDALKERTVRDCDIKNFYQLKRQNELSWKTVRHSAKRQNSM